VSILAAALIGVLVYGLAKQGTSRALDAAVRAGQRPRAPEITRALPVLVGIDRRTAALERWRGQVVVINFWASWCPTCGAEAGLLERAERYLSARHEGTVLGVTYKDITSYSLSWLRQHGLTFPNVRDIDGSFAEGYGTAQLPETFVLDRRLRVVAISRGELTSESWLMHAMNAAAQA